MATIFPGRFSMLILVIVAICAPSHAQESPAARKGDEQATTRGLPAEATTNHAITIDGEKIAFVARAGAVRLRDAQTDAPQADVAYVSVERTGVDAAARPIIFVFNGGPGAGSAWLALGALSPWRLQTGSQALSPSATPVTVDNMESWIPFADLVFIDPPGTGFSKILGDSEELKKRLFSVEGDADALAVVIRKWLAAHGRLAAPKFIAGESYGGFRAVKLLRALRERENVGVDGVALISPALDFFWLQNSRNLLSYAALLPSFAAVARGAQDRGALRDVEAYAAADYVIDLLKGPKELQALDRASAHVARIASLDPLFVARLGARVDAKSFSRERRRRENEILSAYDADVAGFDPDPFAPESDWADPVLDSWRTPLGAAMARVVIEKLGWAVGEARYAVLNGQVAHQWDFGRGGRANAEVLSDLKDALALDPRLKVLVVHGLSDLVTPYFATKLMLDQLPAYGNAERVRLVVLPGGHMPYLREGSRKALRDAGRDLVRRPSSP